MIKKTFLTCVLFVICFFEAYPLDAWIRINQLGYLPNSNKKAVLISESPLKINNFSIYDALTNEKIADFNTVKSFGRFDKFAASYALDFTTFKTEGAFYIKAGHCYSPTIFINKSIYYGTADFLLQYMRQQRCGYNPVLDDYCHQFDGVVIDGTPEKIKSDAEPNVLKSINTTAPSKTATKKALESKTTTTVPTTYPAQPEFINVTGGWHDASDYLQYGTTSATAIYQMLFAYGINPQAFSDHYNALGQAGSNGIPDILDEVKWGLDWLLKMYPDKETIYHQIADDRDHDSSYRLPVEDSVDYGWGPGRERPVYKATGKPQGLFGNMNHSTGLASIAGKYASAFALGAIIMADFNHNYADTLEQKAIQAYELGKKYPGVSQTVPGKSPYYYEEDNWTDDMELAAIQLYSLTFESKYKNDAIDYGRKEPVSPWIFSESSHHYQWYPFINIGHYMLSNLETPGIKQEFTLDIKANLQRAQLRTKENPFGVSIPMIWCSNNYAVALATQCNLYRKYTADSTFTDMENSLTDWLFGCNPWGISMVVDLPETGLTPKDPHSAFSHTYQIPVSGGLIDGPVDKNVFSNLIGVHLSKPDPFEPVQTDWAVYHDDYSDYSTNEPTMDGTASLTYLLSEKQFEGKTDRIADKNVYDEGTVVRTNPEKKQITLVFSGNEFADGVPEILKTLNKLKIDASFFLSGNFVNNKKNKKLVQKIVDQNYYVGVHSNAYLTYCAETDRDSVIIQQNQFTNDLRANFEAFKKFGVYKQDAPFFMAPNGAYNDSISLWSKKLGLALISPTRGIMSMADLSTPEMRDNYFSSLEIFNQIMEVEKKSGLNGYILVFHLGSDAKRTDKFYNRLGTTLTELKKRGYQFTNLYQATNLRDKNPKPETKKRKDQ